MVVILILTKCTKLEALCKTELKIIKQLIDTNSWDHIELNNIMSSFVDIQILGYLEKHL